LKARKKIRRKSEESGIALLLSIFVLLLVCVVGIAMLSASGTESSLSGNYRSATAVYYAALSGLEEGRGRLVPRNPNYLGTTLLPPILPLGNVIYIVNPLPGDTAASVLATYPDTEYATEYPTYNPPSNVSTVTSAPTITSPANSPNPLYKWVRITAITEGSLQIDVNNSGFISPVEMVYFDGTNLKRSPAAYQPLEVTALAALPDGSRKLLQYVVAPTKLDIPIAAALTLAGGIPGALTFNPSSSAASFYINGNDQEGNGGLPCPTQAALPGVGVFNDPDRVNVNGSLSSPPPRAGHYTGAVGVPSPNPPNVGIVHPSDPTIDMTDPVQLSSLVQTIQGVADVVLTGPVTGSNMPSAMTSANPMTVMVNGDLTLTNFTGYGLLVVTGKLTYADDSGWKGIVLVIGQGVVEQNGSGSGNGEFDGALFVAKVNSGGGGGGSSLGTATYTVSSGKGIYYDSCWIAQALTPVSYKVLSFHEITPP
jgi:hypothetical protein